VSRDADGVLTVTALTVENGQIVEIYPIRNPKKLQHVHSP
jgi:hypothetical protein